MPETATEIHRRLADVLTAVLTATAGTSLPPMYSWSLRARDARHDAQPTVSGQMGGPLDRGREAVTAWARALDGEVVETEYPTYVLIEAHARVAGVLVVVWDHIVAGESE